MGLGRDMAQLSAVRLLDGVGQPGDMGHSHVPGFTSRVQCRRMASPIGGERR